MNKFYLIDYLKNNYRIDKNILDNLKYELDQCIYYYGKHFRYPREVYELKKFNSLKQLFKKYIIMFKMLFFQKINDKKSNIISNAYFNYNEELRKIGYRVFRPIWDINWREDLLPDVALYSITEQIKNILRGKDYGYLISEEFVNMAIDFEILLKEFYTVNGIQAIIMPNDLAFFEKMSLKIFREIKKPSFLFIHGFPVYNNIDNNRADFLVVFGEKIKENFIKVGVDGNKILVSGHPYYQNQPKNKNLQFGFENILVITKPMSGSQFSDEIRVSDRGNSVYYLYSIEHILTKLGIRSVRLRLHPSESDKWYLKFINTNFFKVDLDNIMRSLNRATLVIGPTSTLFLESVYYGVNYLIYEPSEDDFDLFNFKLAPPFDGTDNRIPVAKNENQLEQLLREKVMIDKSFLGDYLKTPFDISSMKNFV